MGKKLFGECYMCGAMTSHRRDGNWSCFDCRHAKYKKRERDRRKVSGKMRALREVVFSRDHNRCVMCGSSDELQLDHIVPFESGGVTTLENLRTLCRKCNTGKGARDSKTFALKNFGMRLIMAIRHESM